MKTHIEITWTRYADSTVIFQGTRYAGEYEKTTARGVTFYRVFFRGQFRGNVLDADAALENIRHHLDTE